MTKQMNADFSQKINRTKTHKAGFFQNLFAKIFTNLQSKVKQNDHFIRTGLEECVFYVVVQDINFIAPQGSISES